MKNKSKWIFTVASVVIVIAVAIILVLREKYHNKTNTVLSDAPSNTDTYATSFSLNLPDTIEMNIGSKLKLKDGYVNVTPSGVLNKLEFDIVPKGNSSRNGISFENNMISANEIGSYSIKFKIPKSDYSFYSKTININVYPMEEEIFIKQKSDSLIIGETKSVYELYTVVTGKNFTISTDEKIQFLNNYLTALEVGISRITFSCAENFMEFIYDFNLTIKNEPEYQILISNVTNNTKTINMLNNEYSYIYYQIVDRDEKYVTQDIDVESQDESIVIIDEIANDNSIKLQALKHGETKITIFLTDDPTIKVEIIVIVV